MDTVYMPLRLTPGATLGLPTFNQPILPNGSFNLFSINLGRSNNAQVEDQVLQRVGSYGRQIGHLADALEVVIEKLALLQSKDLSRDQRDALLVFLGDVAAVRSIKP